MTDETGKPSVIAASDIEVDHASLDASIAEFTGKNGDYYAKPNTEDVTEAIYQLMRERDPANYPEL